MSIKACLGPFAGRDDIDVALERQDCAALAWVDWQADSIQV